MSSSIAPLFRSTEEQLTPLPATVTGNIPEWLDGGFLIIGPALFEIGDFKLNHYFDGFSMLAKFDISKGKVSFVKKFLQSDAFKKAQISKKPVYTEFGTKAYTDLTKNVFSRVISSVIPDLTDNCALNLFCFKGQVYVCSESALIRKINPKTLETLEKVDLTKSGATLISAHPQVDSHGDLYNMVTEVFTSAHYSALKVPAKSDNKNPFKKAEVMWSLSPQAKNPSWYHSFGHSENYLVFIEQPMVISMMKIMSFQIKGRSFHDCMEWQPHLMNRFHVTDKRTGKLLTTQYVSTLPFFCVHFINCYEENNQLVIDVITYDTPELFNQMYLNVVRNDKFTMTNGGCGHRFVLPLLQPNQVPEEGKNLVTLNTLATAEYRGGSIHVTGCLISVRGFEQPFLNRAYLGRKYRYFYASGMIDCGEMRNTVLKVDTETGECLRWRESDHSFPQGPYFVPNPACRSEDDGVLLVPINDTDPNVLDSLVILDAATLHEVARARLSCHLPNLVHGLFLHRDTNLV